MQIPKLSPCPAKNVPNIETIPRSSKNGCSALETFKLRLDSETLRVGYRLPIAHILATERIFEKMEQSSR